MKKTFFALSLLTLFVFSGCNGPHVHTPSEPTEENRIEPTCTKDGSYDLVVYCVEDHVEISREHKIIPALGHDLIHHEKKDESCTEIGWDSYDTCSRCNYSTYVIKAAKGHTPGRWIIDKDATCTEVGSKHQVCAECGETIDTDSIPAKGHTLGRWIIDKDATCTEVGSKHQVCAECGETIDTDSIPSKGHTLGRWIIDKDATCTEVGSKHQVCEECGITIDTQIIDIKDHELIETRVEPTKKSDGYVEKTCKNCDYYEKIVLHSTGSIGLSYTLFNDCYYVSGIGTCTDEDIVIPEYYNDLPVTSIGAKAFNSCDSIKSVEFPNSISQIGRSAFEFCQNLNYIKLPEALNSIGSFAFSECKNLIYVILPKNNVSLNYRSFDSGNVYFYYPGTIEEAVSQGISNSDYYYYLDNEPTSDEQLFWHFENNVPKLWKNNYFEYTGNDNDKTAIITGYTSSDLEWNVTIPEELDGYTIKGVEDLFWECAQLSSISLPASITSINNSFSHCPHLKEVYIPESVKSISTRSFENDISLTSIIVDPSNPYYDSRNDCNAIINSSNDVLVTGCKTTKIPDSVVEIGEESFYYCQSLTSIIIPDSVTRIRRNAFLDCGSLSKIVIPNSIEYIDTYGLSCNRYESHAIEVFFKGTATNFIANNVISNSLLKPYTVYYYSEEQPSTSGIYWHFVDETPTIWVV